MELQYERFVLWFHDVTTWLIYLPLKEMAQNGTFQKSMEVIFVKQQ